MMTNSKPGCRSRKHENSLSILFQFPQMSRGGRKNPNGAPPSSSTNLQKARDVMVERLVQRDDAASSGKQENGMRSVMDRSDLFSRKWRLLSWRRARDVNQLFSLGCTEETRRRLLTVSSDAYSKFLERARTPIQYMLTVFPVNISELDRAEVYTTQRTKGELFRPFGVPRVKRSAPKAPIQRGILGNY